MLPGPVIQYKICCNEALRFQIQIQIGVWHLIYEIAAVSSVDSK